MNSLNIIYLFVAMLLFFSIIGSSFSARIGMPLLLIFLGMGMLAGEEGLLGIEFHDFTFANIIGQAALAVILLDGGLRTSIKQFRIALQPAVALATWGVLATVALLGVFATFLLNLDWRFGVLLAAIVGSTDAAAVFSLLRNGGVRLNERVQATLEIESGANDPMAILLVTGFTALNIDPNSMNVLSFFWLLVQQLGIGLLSGLVCGYFLSLIMPKLRLAEGMYAILIFSGGMMVFAATNLLNGSGFLAIYLTGIVIGNRRTRATEHVLRVMDGMAWLAQATLFLVLGMLVTPSQMFTLWPYALALFAVLFLLARPLAVFSSLKPFRFRNREILFISWVGLRGAVPVTLAMLPIMAGVEQAQLLFNLAFAIVILSLLIQGTTIPMMARFFKVRIPTTNEPDSELEIWVGDHANIYIYEFTVRKGSFAAARHPDEIAKRINSDEVRLFAFVRSGEIQAIDSTTSLRSGDRIWYIVRGKHADSLARIFNNTLVERRERTEFFGEWIVSPRVLIGELSLFADNADITQEIRQQTIEEFIHSKRGDSVVVGDQAELNDEWSLIVREVSDNNTILSVGLKLDREDKKKKHKAEPEPVATDTPQGEQA